jgi:hypothetical protein
MVIAGKLRHESDALARISFQVVMLWGKLFNSPCLKFDLSWEDKNGD